VSPIPIIKAPVHALDDCPFLNTQASRSSARSNSKEYPVQKVSSMAIMRKRFGNACMD